MRVTVDPFDGLYWSPYDECTYVCLSRVDLEGLWLPVDALIGHWHWFTGDILGARIVRGYGPSGVCGPVCEQIWPSPDVDPDTGRRYWRSDRGRYCYWWHPDRLAYSHT